MKSTVKIALAHNEFKEVEGELYGSFAVTPSGEAKGYKITLVANGYALTPTIPDKKKAKELARRLEQHAESFTRLSTTRSTHRNKMAAAILKELWLEVGLPKAW